MRTVKTTILVAMLFAGIIIPVQTIAHCQIPCGIYGDDTRFDLLAEHIATVEKSMNQINELSKANPINYNQLVRWIENKEKHTAEISEIITYYFMAQRIAEIAPDQPGYSDYINKITLLHQILRTNMKCKQTTDLENVEKLKGLVDKFKKAYQGEM